MDGEKAREPPPRVARLVLVTLDGAVVGRMAPVPVALPWWQEAQSKPLEDPPATTGHLMLQFVARSILRLLAGLALLLLLVTSQCVWRSGQSTTNPAITLSSTPA